MAILNDLKEGFSSMRDPFPNDPLFVLTALGQQKATAFEADGPELKILTALHERGPSDVNEISRATGFEVEKCKLIIRKLIRQRLVHQQ